MLSLCTIGLAVRSLKLVSFIIIIILYLFFVFTLASVRFVYTNAKITIVCMYAPCLVVAGARASVWPDTEPVPHGNSRFFDFI